MAEKVLMIALSPTMEQGTIVSWNKKVGDEVSSGDVICEVETDKATMEYESAQEGTLLKIILPEGGQAAVGQSIAILGEKGEDISDLEKEIASENITKESGNKEDSPKEAEAEKNAKETADAPPSGAESTSAEKPAEAPKTKQQFVHEGDRVYASPLAREMARQAGLDIGRIRGSGPNGRIVQRDIRKALERPGDYTAALAASGSPAASPSLEDRSVPLSGMRRTIAQRLAASKFSAPHFYLKVKVRGEGLVSARQTLNARLKDKKVSVNAFLIKFAAEALSRHRGINAGWKEDSIVEFGSVDIGLAVSVPGGLVTPVVRNCANKGVEAIDAELSGLIEKAKKGQLSPEEYSGATFTISNLGSFGIDEFTAIINPPGSAILAVGALKDEAAVVDGEVVAAKLMTLTLSCDHRVIDGAAGAAFLDTLKRFIEDPVQMMY